MPHQRDQSLSSDNGHCARGGSSHSPRPAMRKNVAWLPIKGLRPGLLQGNNNALCVMQIWERVAKPLFNFETHQSNQSIKGINTGQKQINEDDFKKFDILTQISDGDYYW